MLKALAFTFLLLLHGTALQAQYVHITLASGETEQHPIEEIRGISYGAGMMHFHRYDGGDLSWRIGDVEHYHFYEPTGGFDDAARSAGNVRIFKRPQPEVGPVDFDPMNRAIARMDAQDYAGAEALLDAYTEEYPHNEYALLLQGNARRFAGEYEAAVESYTRALVLNPIYFNAFLNRGLSHAMLGRTEETLADYGRAIAVDPGNARGYHERGYALHQDGRDPSGAMRDYDRTIELDPTNPYAYVNRGILKADRSDRVGAIWDYRAALEIDPDQIWAWNNLGNVVMSLANLSQEGALAILVEHFEFEGGIELLPDAVNVVGNPELHVAVHEVAIRHYDRAIAIDPSYATAYGNKALSRLYQGLMPEACELWKVAHDLGDESAAGYMHMCE